MKWIESQEIDLWSQRIDSKGNLPWLVARLIRATTPLNTTITFPKGADTYSGGWDGIVETTKKTTKVPEGKSLWELTTDSHNKRKADRDYDKRVLNPLVDNPKEFTYVFVTARKWSTKQAWVGEKKAQNFWKDVIVYDAVDLEHWLDDTPATAKWFGILIGKPYQEGIQDTEEFWREFSINPEYTLLPEVVTGNRQAESEEIKRFLAAPFALKAVRASTKDEAIAFIIASVMQHNQNEREDFFSKSLVVDNVSVFRNISFHQFPLVLIARFEDARPLQEAVTRANHVLVPLGADDNSNGIQTIDLPGLGRDLQDALVKSGLSHEDAMKYCIESGQNLTVLRRLLKFNSDKIKWAEPEIASSLIPALLVGRWDESKPGDKEFISALAGEDYTTYIDKINLWKNDPIPFIYQIGTYWRLASPFDAWSILSKNIHKAELDQLRESLFIVLTEIKPALELAPEQRHMAFFYGKESPYSYWLREGITQSLILIAIYGNNLKIQFPITSQEWVDDIVKSLLETKDGNLWKSLDNIMPLLAEASPESFMDAVRSSIDGEKKAILEMFQEDPNFITPQTYHTGLLWALEGVAWFKDFLPKAALLLLKLATNDPGGSIVNRPINSLGSIFLPWMPQTFADVVERKNVLKLLVIENEEIGWQLLLMLLPKHHGIAHPTHKSRWRLFNEPAFQKGVSYQERIDMHHFVLNELIKLSHNEEAKLAVLLDSIDILSIDDQQFLLNHIDKDFDPQSQKLYTLWHSIRKTLNHHRAFPESPNTYPEEWLKNYQSLYTSLTPIGIVERNIWLFDEYPKFADVTPETYKNFDLREKVVIEKRKEALNTIYNEYGIEKIIELAETVKEQYHYGTTLAAIIDNENDTLKILNHSWLSMIPVSSILTGFIMTKSFESKIDWVITYFELLTNQEYSETELSNFLVPVQFDQNLFDFLESLSSDLQDLYWVKSRPYLYQLTTAQKEFVFKKLINVGRQNTAVSELWHFIKEFSTEFIFYVLESKIGKANIDDALIRSSEMQFVFQDLYERTDIDRSRLARLEWFYLPYFGFSSSRSDNTLLLQGELSSNPQFFVEILSFLYKSADDKEENENDEKIELSEDEINHKKVLANNAYHLLSAWEKIPGLNETGIIDSEFLNAWVDTARELAQEASRIKVADVHIGKLLAKYPEKEAPDQWPPDEICSIIDTIKSDSLSSGFSTETYNKRGSTTRGAFEGGNIERGWAEYFKLLAKKIDLKWPITSSILKGLSKGYMERAKRVDEEATRSSLDY